MNLPAKEIRVVAKTLEHAVNEAAQKLNVQPHRVVHKVVSQTRGGWLSLWSRKIEIIASVQSDDIYVDGTGVTNQQLKPKQNLEKRSRRRDTAVYSVDDETSSFAPAESLAATPELTESETRELIEELRVFCEEICTRMFSQPARVEAEVKGDRLILNVDCEELISHFTKNPKMSESLEHILRKKPRHLKRELPFRIFVDVNGHRLRREEEIIGMARDLSAKVMENQKPIVLNYKNSYDRKIIHMALEPDKRVYTKSIGSGSNRKLMILPYKGKSEESLTDSQ